MNLALTNLHTYKRDSDQSRNDKKEPKLISIAIGRNQDQGPFANKSVKKKVDRLLAQSKNISHFCYYLWNGDI